MQFTFQEVLNKSVPEEKRFRGRLLALDPGHTTGVCIHVEGMGFHLSQIKTWGDDLEIKALSDLFNIARPDHVVFERYGVYSWKTEDHSNSDVPTLQVIGCIKTLCIQQGIAYSNQTAQLAKGFVTDEKLKQWDLWEAGVKHGRDAARHAVYWLLFNHQKQK